LDFTKKVSKSYTYPQSSLLTEFNTNKSNTPDDFEIKDKESASRLESILGSYGINTTITNVIHGPSVTRYELLINEGTKASELIKLADDIAFSIGAEKVRIAPVPNKTGVMGIGIPNKITTMYLRELIESQEFTSTNEPTSVIIGRGVYGQNIITDLKSLSHLLIAGAEGSGKTIFLDSLITSLLFKASPEQLRFIMIDAKMVDLNIYKDIPHLITPITSNGEKAISILEDVSTEIDRRYNLLLQGNYRDIDAYNSAMVEKTNDKLFQRIVVIIDHLAMLYNVQNELEDILFCISEKASKCGVHLILSTQQPEAKVIKCIISVLNPSRISFYLNSQKGSKIILGTYEAVKLLGSGDMLYLPIGADVAFRVQGCYVSEEEIKRVATHIQQL